MGLVFGKDLVDSLSFIRGEGCDINQGLDTLLVGRGDDRACIGMPSQNQWALRARNGSSQRSRIVTQRCQRNWRSEDSQALLLKGVNDDADVMKALVHRLLRMRVRPYYLYQMDLITGGSHFKVDVRKGIEIIRALRGHTTGYAVPQYVIDAPGGGGKVPINPEYIESIDDRQVVFKNYRGETFRYPLTNTPRTESAKAANPVVMPSELFT